MQDSNFEQLFEDLIQMAGSEANATGSVTADRASLEERTLDFLRVIHDRDGPFNDEQIRWARQELSLRAAAVEAARIAARTDLDLSDLEALRSSGGPPVRPAATVQAIDALAKPPFERRLERRAAGTLDAGVTATSHAVSEALTVLEAITVGAELYELACDANGRIYIRGQIPAGAAFLLFGEVQFQLKPSEIAPEWRLFEVVSMDVGRFDDLMDAGSGCLNYCRFSVDD